MFLGYAGRTFVCHARKTRRDFKILSHIMVGNWPPRRFLLLLPAFMKRDSVFIATQGTGRSERRSRRFGISI
jgi:hypothetical protein